MKETRTINLNGIVFHIDNDAYLALSNYLHDIELRLPSDDRKEVLNDLEARIAELFQSALFAKNVQVVDISMVHAVESRIGKPSDFGENKRPVVKHKPSDNQGCARSMGIALKVVLILMALPFLFIFCIVAFSLLLALFGVSAGLATALPLLGIELFAGSGWLTALFVIAVLAVIILPIVMLIHSIVTYARSRRGPKARFWWSTISAWLLAVVLTIVLMFNGIRIDGQPANIRQVIQLIDDGIDESGEPTTTVVLELPAFQSVEVTGPIEVELTQALTQSVELTSSHPDQVLAEVEDGVLKIAFRPNHNRYTEASFAIAVPELQRIEATAAAQIETEGVFKCYDFVLTLAGAAQADLNLQGKSLKINATGASKAELDGEVESFTAEVAGASKLEADDLKADNVHVNCAGASYVAVYPVKQLWAQAAGASKITYRGKPDILHQMAVGASQIGAK
ncbi:MAG: GIN domain-containing protein [Paludibacteraceae bacterium]